MGFFSTIREVNETTHGKRLEKDFQETMEFISSFDEVTFGLVLDRFVELFLSLFANLKGVKISESLALAQKMQTEARSLSGHDDIEACAIWMASAWLEYLARKSEEANRVYAALDDILIERRQENYKQGANSRLWENKTNRNDGFPYYELCDQYDYWKKSKGSMVFYKNVPYRDGSQIKEYPCVAVFYREGHVGRHPAYCFATISHETDGSYSFSVFASDGKEIVAPEESDEILADQSAFVLIVTDFYGHLVD